MRALGFRRPAFVCIVVDMSKETRVCRKDTIGEEGVQKCIDRDTAFDEKEPEFEGRKPESEVNVSPSSNFEDFSDNSINENNTAGALVPTVGQISSNGTNTFSVAGPSNDVASPTHGKSSCIDTSQLHDDPNMPELEDITYFDDEDDVGAEADFNNLETSITVSPIPKKRVHKDHPVTQIIGDLSSATQTRISPIPKKRVHKDHPVTQIIGDLSSATQTRSMTRVAKDQVGLKICRRSFFNSRCRRFGYLVDFPHGKRAIGTKWVFRNKKDERGFVVRSKPQLVAQGHTQEEGIDYEEVFAPVYVCQPPGFEDPDYPNKVYKVVKAFMVYIKLLEIDLCKAFEKLMKYKFQMSSMRELTFFLGLQIKQKEDGIFISQDKYVAEILRKFGLTEGKSARQTATGKEISNPFMADDAEGVDCLPNEEIFTGLARMEYEKPSTKLTFYKTFFLSQWKFLIHTILQSLSAKRTPWNEFSCAMASAVICLSTGRKCWELYDLIIQKKQKNETRGTKDEDF
nr:hypothetical protein [Tanacetum cinerariifolium]